MRMHSHHLRSIAGRFVCGFIASWLLCWLFLALVLDYWPGPGPLSSTAQIRAARAPYICGSVAASVAMAVTIVGSRRVSTFWLWWGIVFAVICVIPFWSSWPKGNTLLPLGTPYVNGGLKTAEGWRLLAAHLSMSALIAGAIWKLGQPRHNGPAETQDGKAT